LVEGKGEKKISLFNPHRQKKGNLNSRAVVGLLTRKSGPMASEESRSIFTEKMESGLGKKENTSPPSRKGERREDNLRERTELRHLHKSQGAHNPNRRRCSSLRRRCKTFTKKKKSQSKGGRVDHWKGLGGFFLAAKEGGH